MPENRASKKFHRKRTCNFLMQVDLWCCKFLEPCVRDFSVAGTQPASHLFFGGD